VVTSQEQQTATVADVVDAVHRRYDPATAAPWDSVGLTCGDPAAPVRRVLLAVDPVAATVDEALATGTDLLLTHHPLLFRPVTSVAATTPTGHLVHRLVRGGCAHLAAHTNADVARDGVGDALAAALGVLGCVPVLPSATDPGAGLGRVGDLAGTLTLAEFAESVLAALPRTAHGVRIAGDPGRPVRRVVVLSGSGGDDLPAASLLGADVIVTADLKHHVASDHLAAGGPALIDVAHFASEWPWLAVAARLLAGDLAARGLGVETRVSTLVTDPWTDRL
jgi:dinuclear metal center YbgI/SA1388 family protein